MHSSLAANLKTRPRFTAPKVAIPWAGLLFLLLLPPAALGLGEPYVVVLFTRIVILAIAAIGLDLILGYGGMVSFGHAAFVGAGGYTAGVLMHHAFEESPLIAWPVELGGAESALVTWPAAALASALLALVIGAISLRTSGVYFIMITLAFAQMLFYLTISFQRYGGEDGLILFERATLPGLDLEDDVTFYYVCLALMLAVLGLARRLVDSRFGMVLRGCRQNPVRMQALGFPIYRYRLTAFVIAGAVAGLAGALLINLGTFVSPALLAWTRSGEILVMVILGGMGTLVGPIFGAAALLLLEEYLGAYTEHWMAILGPVLILVVLLARRGLYGWLAGGERSG
jgi:branched-chain amino acid transport system permease protein